MPERDLILMQRNLRQKTSRARRALLAQIHIAKKELLKNHEGAYRDCIRAVSGGRTDSAANLTMEELERLRDDFVHLGWPRKRAKPSAESWLIALRKRINQMAKEIPLDGQRLEGLCRSLCATDDPAWCRDTEKLRRLLAALGKIKRRERHETKDSPG